MPSGAGSVLRLERRRILRVRTLSSSPISRSPAQPPPGALDNKAGPPSSSSLDLHALRNKLKERASSVSAAATLSLAELGERLNKVTGYEQIERLKRKVVETEAAIAARRQASRDAKTAYEEAVARRSNSQREVNDLLQRKSGWTDADVGRFTVLVREDHTYEQEEARAKTQVALAESAVEAEFNGLMRTILNRYHEEQVWSDKIRSASTYGSLLALGVNIAVFFLAIVVVEPWKRRRLAQTFERRIEALSLENREVLGQGMGDLARHFEKQERVLAQLQREDEPAEAAEMNDEAAAVPVLSRERTARTARDRELWVAGAVGAVGGGVLTLMLNYFL